jgi:hypothetical protein
MVRCAAWWVRVMASGLSFPATVGYRHGLAVLTAAAAGLAILLTGATVMGELLAAGQ